MRTHDERWEAYVKNVGLNLVDPDSAPFTAMRHCYAAAVIDVTQELLKLINEHEGTKPLDVHGLVRAVGASFQQAAQAMGIEVEVNLIDMGSRH